MPASNSRRVRRAKNKQVASRKRMTLGRLLTLPEYPFKISLLQKHTSSGTGVIGQVIHVLDPSGCTDFLPLASLFDLYRVNKVKITAYPSYNVSDLSSLSAAFNPLYVAYDADSTANVASEDGMIQYGNCKTYNLFKKWSYTVRPINNGDNSVNNAGLVTYQKYGREWLDMAHPGYYQQGIIMWYSEAQQADTQFFTLKVDFYISLCNRR